ncbi:MAG: HD-GYP domain-containing protein [Eubacteriales bacterium]|nr:HD-GYP domain-containing protein [Eubacteriales bacterium]
MNKRARVYIAVVITAGMIGLGMCLTVAITNWNNGFLTLQGGKLLVLTFLCAVCRSFPITIRKNQGLDLSVIAVLAAFLLTGMEATILMYAVSSLFTFDKQEDGRYHSIYNTSLQKSLFNISNIILAILIPGMVCRIFPWTPGDFSVPLVLGPTLVFTLLSFFFNYALLLVMFLLNGDISLTEAKKVLLGLTTNVIAAMPLGLIIALLLAMPMGPWLTLLMICPLLLARYAWKLYVDSCRHKDELITAFVSAIEARDEYTKGHSARVGEYAERIARKMGLSEKEIFWIREGALLHDIGKIGVSDQILHKNGRLTSAEWNEMKRHPLIGKEMVAKVGLDKEVIDLILSHHERYDGKGYPDGKPISLCAPAVRVMSVADAFDAMTTDRPYRLGMSIDAALQELRNGSGTQFDPTVVEAMASVMQTTEIAK